MVPTGTQDDSFETAVADVEGAVTTTRKIRKFPVPPKGSHKAKCIDAKLREKEFQGIKNTVLTLTWELEKTYENEVTKQQEHFRLFDDLSLYYGPKARLHKVFKELTNEDISPLVVQKKFKKNGEDFIQEVFQYKGFTGMTAEITVVHKEGKSDPSRVFANVGAYTCQPEEQKKNSDLVFAD